MLSVKALEETDTHPMGRLDFLWVCRWLVDMGLEQYKDAFADARIDGRTLNYLTTVRSLLELSKRNGVMTDDSNFQDDLLYMRITNSLHHVSLKRGLQVLRHCNFDLSRIQRRAANPDVRFFSRKGSFFMPQTRSPCEQRLLIS